VSTESVAEAIGQSGETGAPLRICGRGEWLDAGRPVDDATTLSLRDDKGVVAYVPGDLTLTVRAGTTLADIQRVTDEHDQWLPLDPFGSNQGTIGATIATGSAGPLATGFGLPRDLVLGTEFVNGRGEVIRTGGRVVKNVAGFDLTRLITGSWGTLGVITEVTVRLYARPKVDRTFALKLSQGDRATTSFLRAFLGAPVNPYAFELIGSSAANRLELGEQPTAIVRFGGNAAAVDAQIRALSALMPAEEVRADIWDRFRNLERESETVIRISGLPARFRDAASTILGDSYPEILTYISAARGSMRLVMLRTGDGEISDDALLGMEQANRPDEHLIFEKLPPEVWPTIPSAVSDPLSQGIKKSYDPKNILNPGILGA
jgi:glycolate oxidase FAD binding subunit